MNTSSTLAAILALLTFFYTTSNQVHGQQPFDFFWSAEDLGSGNIVNEDLEIILLQGESQTINFYYTTDGPAQSELRVGGGLDIQTSDAGTIQFDDGETFEFDILLENNGRMIPVDERWATSDGFGLTGTANIAADFIDNFDFFTILGSGIVNANKGPVFFDAGYDFDSDAFLIGSISFTALEIGSTNIVTSVDAITSLTNDGFVPLAVEFANVTVHVVPQFELADGVLTVFGTNDDDEIEVSVARETTTVVINGQQQHFAGVTEIVIDSRNGNDQVDANVNYPATIQGGNGNDVLSGGSSPDNIEGGSGNDEIDGRGGADLLNGGSGRNTISGGNGPDTILGGSGVDIVFGGAGADVIMTFGGSDVITAGSGNDEIDAGDGADEILGGAGNDLINAGAGNDIVNGGSGQDEINGGNGSDELSGGRASDVIQGGDGNDIINGNDGLDELNGGPGADQISGGRGSDTISGGSGNDDLSGQSGNDTIKGNGGDDVLTGGIGNDLLDGGSGNDTAVDDGEQGEISIENS